LTGAQETGVAADCGCGTINETFIINSYETFT
jgi:hypothetical protein